MPRQELGESFFKGDGSTVHTPPRPKRGTRKTEKGTKIKTCAEHKEVGRLPWSRFLGDWPTPWKESIGRLPGGLGPVRSDVR